MAAETRELLKPWASQETTSTFDKLFEKVGAHEGCGGLLRIAALDPTGSGQLTDAEADRFLAESSLLFEEIIHFLNLAALVSALAFTVAVPLAVLNLDGLSTFDAIDASSAVPRVRVGTRFGTGRGYCTQLIGRGIFCYALSVYAAFNAIALCFVMIPSYSFYLPDVESRLRFFVQDHDKIQNVLGLHLRERGVAASVAALPRGADLAGRVHVRPHPGGQRLHGVSTPVTWRPTAMANFQLDIAQRLLADGGGVGLGGGLRPHCRGWVHPRGRGESVGPWGRRTEAGRRVVVSRSLKGSSVVGRARRRS